MYIFASIAKIQFECRIVHKLNVIQCRKCKKVFDFFALIEKKIQQESEHWTIDKFLHHHQFCKAQKSENYTSISMCIVSRKKIRFYVREKTRNVNELYLVQKFFFSELNLLRCSESDHVWCCSTAWEKKNQANCSCRWIYLCKLLIM